MVFVKKLICDLFSACKKKVRHIPPKYNLELAENISRTVENFVLDHSHCIILGDLNLPKLYHHSCNKDPITYTFEKCLSTLGMFHMNQAPTRNENCLDVVLL